MNNRNITIRDNWLFGYMDIIINEKYFVYYSKIEYN